MSENKQGTAGTNGSNLTQGRSTAVPVNLAGDTYDTAAGTLLRDVSLPAHVAANLQDAIAREIRTAAEGGRLFDILHGLALEHGHRPDPAESPFDFLQRLIVRRP